MHRDVSSHSTAYLMLSHMLRSTVTSPLTRLAAYLMLSRMLRCTVTSALTRLGCRSPIFGLATSTMVKLFSGTAILAHPYTQQTIIDKNVPKTELLILLSSLGKMYLWSSVVDPYPYWIRIQELPGSGSGSKLGQIPGSGAKLNVFLSTTLLKS